VRFGHLAREAEASTGERGDDVETFGKPFTTRDGQMLIVGVLALAGPAGIQAFGGDSTRQTTMVMQRCLTALGYDTGGVTGTWNTQTEIMASRYASSKDLNPYADGYKVGQLLILDCATRAVQLNDQAMLAELDRCRREGTPRPESQAIRAHVPATFWSFANTWQDVFRNGVADHNIKELCRIYVSRSVLCEFCGNQRSMKSAKAGLVEDDYRDLINFESSTRYNDKQKAALAYAECITWDLPSTDALWARLHQHFSEAELVEIGYFVAITMGQQRWLRTLNIEHHQILAGTDASMAPGFETKDALAHSKSDPNYWATRRTPPKEAAE